MHRVTGAAVAVLVAGLLAGAAGCASVLGDAAAAPDELRIALLLPESKTARYESHDRPAFEHRVAQLCPECVTLPRNAQQDASRQQAQAEAALTNGADVLVLDPVDSASAAVIVRHADAAGVPVVTYDRLVWDAPVTFHVTFDNHRVGALQAQALLTEVRARQQGDLQAAATPGRGSVDGQVVVLNGAPTDANAAEFRRGASFVLDGEVAIGAEVDVPDWSPDRAQEAMEQALATLGRDAIVGVYSANDGMAAGAIAAMRAAGLDPLPPVTGQDAELAAIRRILAGDQHMTIYKAVRTQARVAAEIAVALARTGEIAPGVRTNWVDNGAGQVPTLMLEPLVVTRETIADTVVADGFWTVEEICRDGLWTACREAGLR